MGIHIHGERFDLRFEENVDLVPEIGRQLAADAAQQSAPTGDRAAQPSYQAPLAIAFSLPA